MRCKNWTHTKLGGQEERDTYTNFDPLSNEHVWSNRSNVSLIHIAAWRGDASALEQLLLAGADATVKTTGDWGLLHFLYVYCSKPRDLAQATRLLLEHGADPRLENAHNNRPLHLLLWHIHCKRSYSRFLANAYTDPTLPSNHDDDDNYHQEIRECLEILLKAGASLSDLDTLGDTPLHLVYRRFERGMSAIDSDFPSQGHPLVPYNFKVKPIIEFSELLIERGCDVSILSFWHFLLHHCTNVI